MEGESTMDAVSSSSPPWTWIFEHLVSQKEVGTPILREMLSSVPDVAFSVSLQRRVALRYLEEAMSAEKVDASVIPLIVTLLEHAQRASISTFPTSLDYSDLLLRVKVEAVLIWIRANPRNWHAFNRFLDRLFPNDTKDVCYLEKRKQLLSLLRSDDEKQCMEMLEKYPVSALQCDILKCITSEKNRSEETFLNKLWQDVRAGKLPLNVGLPVREKEESQEDFHSADRAQNSIGNDDRTDIVGRNSNSESEDAETRHDEVVGIELEKSSLRNMERDTAQKTYSNGCEKKHQHRASGSGLKGKTKSAGQSSRLLQSSKPQLRQRNESGKAITSSSPLKDMKNLRVRVNTAEIRDGSASAQILKSGSGGQEEYCHICKKGGNLVCCNGCPIAVHKRCLGSDSSIVRGEWFCPLCLQKRAAEVVAKAKEEELAAKEKVARFMAELNTKQVTETTASHRVSDDHGVKTDTENIKETLGRKNDTRKIKSLMADMHKEMEANPSEAAVHINNDIQEELGSPSKECHDIINTPPRKKARGLVRDNVTCDEATNDVGGTSSKMVSESQRHPIKAGVLIQAADGDGHDGDIEEDSIDIKKINVNRKQKLKMRENRLIPGLRRKRLPWSKEEEDALKEGVKKFSRDGTWGFQWTRILDFGRGKFHPSRTDIDLKDKWRNLVKTIG